MSLVIHSLTHDGLDDAVERRRISETSLSHSGGTSAPPSGLFQFGSEQPSRIDSGILRRRYQQCGRLAHSHDQQRARKCGQRLRESLEPVDGPTRLADNDWADPSSVWHGCLMQLPSSETSELRLERSNRGALVLELGAQAFH
jgi:hypothetical protein